MFLNTLHGLRTFRHYSFNNAIENIPFLQTIEFDSLRFKKAD